MAVKAYNDHVVDFYLADERLVRRVSGFLGTSLRNGQAAVVVATPEHRSSIERTLAERGVDSAPRPRRGPGWHWMPPRR